MVFRTKPLLMIYRYIYLFLFVCLPVILLISEILPEILLISESNSVQDIICLFVIAIFCVGLPIFEIILVHKNFWEKFFARLIVKDDCICWKCPFRKTIIIPIEQCNYIGVQLEESHNGLPYPNIYFAVRPYPSEYIGKINKVPCREGFVKFWYTEKLSNYICQKLSGDKTGGLLYYRIQSRKKR